MRHLIYSRGPESDGEGFGPGKIVGVRSALVHPPKRMRKLLSLNPSQLDSSAITKPLAVSIPRRAAWGSSTFMRRAPSRETPLAEKMKARLPR